MHNDKRGAEQWGAASLGVTSSLTLTSEDPATWERRNFRTGDIDWACDTT